MSPTDLDVAVEAARVGAAIVGAAFGSAAGTRFKSDANPVTEADHEAEAEILRVLKAMRPDDEVLAEESAESLRGWDQGRVWLIDPLDGTVNFIHSIPQISVSVALWVDGRPEAGVICDVTRNEEFAARAGTGAFLNHEPIEVSPQVRLDQSLIATGFPYDRNEYGEAYARNLGQVLTRVQGIRRLGSAALDLAWVACGRYEGYWEFGIQPWDAGAGVLLVMEAGGKVTDHSGQPHRLDGPGIVASNGSIHDDLVGAVGLALPPHVV